MAAIRPHDKALFDAHDRLLKEALGFLRSAQLNADTPGQLAILGLAARVLQLAFALELLCVEGHAGEADPIARAMLSGMVNLVAIADADSDGRTLAFLMYARTLREKRSERYVAYELLTREQADAQLAHARAEEEAQLADFERLGIKPARLGDSPRTWHGLNSDRDLFEKMGLLHIYELDYGWLSDEAHVNVHAIAREVDEVRANDIVFGPKFESPYESMLASTHAVTETLAQVNLAFTLGRRDEVVIIRDRMRAALTAHTGARRGSTEKRE